MSFLPGWWQKRFLSVEFLVSLAVSAAVAAWIEFGSGRSLTLAILGESRVDLYGAFAAIFGSLLGFVIAAVSIVLGYAESDQLRIVRESKYYAQLWGTFKAAIRALAFATIMALTGLVLDRGKEPLRFVLYANVFSITLSSLRLWRVILVLENIVSLISRPKPKGNSEKVETK